MAMLTVYADESGTDGRSPILAVGGYVSEVPLWDDFQNVWNEMRIEKGSVNISADAARALIEEYANTSCKCSRQSW